MFTLDELASKAMACQSGHISIDDFEDWFRTNSRGAYASNVPGVREAAASIEASFSKFYFQGRNQQLLLKELVESSFPFFQVVQFVYRPQTPAPKFLGPVMSFGTNSQADSSELQVEALAAF